jgi:hypothetical protein
MFPFLRATTFKRVMRRKFRTKAVRKGLVGGSRMWRAIWVLMTLRNGWARLSKSGGAPIKFTEPLREGEAWEVVHVPEDSRRGRGEGRMFFIGPKRKAPRATAMAPPAIAHIGARILEAPSAARVNEILGVDLVSDPEPSPYQRRAERKAAKRALKQDAMQRATSQTAN